MHGSRLFVSVWGKWITSAFRGGITRGGRGGERMKEKDVGRLGETKGKNSIGIY